MTEPTALFTSDDVLRIVQEREELAERLAKVDAKVAAIRTLLGDQRFNELTGKDTKDNRTFRDVMEEALTDAPHGLTYDQLRDAIRDAGMGDALERAPNNFFNTIARLQRMDAWAKVGGRVVLKAYADQMPAEVRAALEAEKPDTPEGTPGLILRVLKDAKHALTAADVLEAAMDADPSTNSGRIYAALSRMALKKKDIARLPDGRYYAIGVEHAAGDNQLADLF